MALVGPLRVFFSTILFCFIFYQCIVVRVQLRIYEGRGWREDLGLNLAYDSGTFCPTLFDFHCHGVFYVRYKHTGPEVFSLFRQTFALSSILQSNWRGWARQDSNHEPRSRWVTPPDETNPLILYGLAQRRDPFKEQKNKVRAWINYTYCHNQSVNKL